MTALAVMALALLPVSDWDGMAIHAHCPLQGRLLYPFFHAGIIHAALNAWVLLSIVFIYEVSMGRLILAYIVAVTIPVDSLETLIPSIGKPTVGLSGCIFFLFGSLSFSVARKMYYQSWMAFYLALGFLPHAMNGWLHLYCYAAGLLLACLQKPFERK